MFHYSNCNVVPFLYCYKIRFKIIFKSHSTFRKNLQSILFVNIWNIFSNSPMVINLLLITKISSYNSCYTQYLSFCYPWLWQHVAGSKHNTLFIKYFNYLKSKNNLLTKQTSIHYFFWGISVTTTIFTFNDGFSHRYLHYHSVGN